jgi:hypothetical protein
VVCSWIDDGATYCLRKRSSPRTNRDPQGDALVGRHAESRVYRAFWNLSPNIYCAVRTWTEGLTTDAITVRWINKNIPSVPTEEVIHEWIDLEWNRYITISKRDPVSTYFDAWSGLTSQQKLHVADQVARHNKALSVMTSDYIETAEGNSVDGEWSIKKGAAFSLHLLHPETVAL